MDRDDVLVFCARRLGLSPDAPDDGILAALDRVFREHIGHDVDPSLMHAVLLLSGTDEVLAEAERVGALLHEQRARLPRRLDGLL